MIQLFKYRLLQNVRDVSMMFWALAFPLLLGTFYSLAFGNMGNNAAGDGTWSEIPVGIVNVSENQPFEAFLDGLDGDLIKGKVYDDEGAAKKALNNQKIKGYFVIDNNLALKLSGNGLEESILANLLNTYEKNASLAMKVATEKPQQLETFLESLGDYQSFTKNASLGGRTLDPMINYFFALLAYACLCGAFLGTRSTFDSQANLSALGARRCISPTHKLKLIFIDLTTLVLIQFVNMLILTAYLILFLKIDLGDNIPLLLFIELMGTILSISIGIAIGSIARLSQGIKIGITVAVSLFPAFLAGLMFGDIRNIIEVHAPLVNRLNPAAVLADAFYCLGVYNDQARLTRNLIILGVMAALLLTVAFLSIRREDYDSI
ncbi:ABC-2 type transport system permease protein [Lachnospiraceae bacterium PFB1-21]|nr:ABC transporter permease [Lachnospiraceae bacterium OttesenSCG-928-J05]